MFKISNKNKTKDFFLYTGDFYILWTVRSVCYEMRQTDE